MEIGTTPSQSCHTRQHAAMNLEFIQRNTLQHPENRRQADPSPPIASQEDVVADHRARARSAVHSALQTLPKVVALREERRLLLEKRKGNVVGGGHEEVGRFQRQLRQDTVRWRLAAHIHSAKAQQRAKQQRGNRRKTRKTASGSGHADVSS